MSRRLISGTVVAILLAYGAVGCSDDSPEPSAGSTPTASQPGDGDNETGTPGDGDTGTAGGDEGDGASDGTATTPAPTASEPTGDAAESAQPTKKGKQTAVFSRVPGKASGCVVVSGKRDVRSGGIVGGPFDTVGQTWAKKQPGQPRRSAHFYWVPLHTAKMPGVTVVATHRGSGTRVEEHKDSYGDAEQWKFYDTLLTLPKAGTWELRVEAGPDTGCFVMTLPG